LQPKTTVDIKSNAGGEILLMKVDVGDRVRKGDLIAEIDPTDARTQLSQAEADQRAAQWKIAQSQNTVEFGELADKETVGKAEKAATAAKLRLAQSQAKLESLKVSVPANIEGAKRNLEVTTAAVEQMEKATHPQARASAAAEVMQWKETVRTDARDL